MIRTDTVTEDVSVTQGRKDENNNEKIDNNEPVRKRDLEEGSDEIGDMVVETGNERGGDTNACSTQSVDDCASDTDKRNGTTSSILRSEDLKADSATSQNGDDQDVLADADNQDASKEKSSESADKGIVFNTSVGRRGDPRMHRAVAARRANPNMSLLEALIIGGFKFPNGTDGGNGKSDRNVYDSDNVLLCQRKNQLSRRLRLAKRRSYESKANVGSFTGKHHLDQKDALLSSLMSTTTASTIQRNPATKRGFFGGQNIDELIAATRHKASNDVKLETSPTFYSSSPLPQSSLLALLQQQQQQQQQSALGQTQAYLNNPSSSFPYIQQGLNNPFALQNQIPLNFALNGTNQSNNGNNNQNTTQNNLDQYLAKMTGSSIGLTNHKPMLFPQQNVQPGTGHFLLNQEAALQNMKSSNDTKPKTSIDKDEKTRSRQMQSKLEKAAEIFNLERNTLIGKCLIMAGFGKDEIRNHDLVHDFEDLLRRKR